MKINLTLAEAERLHPEMVAGLIQEIQATGNQRTDRVPAAWRWRYEFAIRHRGYSLGEVLDGTADAEQVRKEALVVEERIAEQLNSVVGCKLVASCYRTSRWRMVPVENAPAVRKWIEASVRRQVAEEQEYAALPESERKRRAEEALRELRKDPGFFEIPARGIVGIDDLTAMAERKMEEALRRLREEG